VKSTDYTVDSVWTKLFSFSQWALNNDFTGPGVSTTYSWLAKETKLNVAELSFDTLGNPKNFTWSSIPPLTTGVVDTDADDVRIYPQPASGSFTIQLPEGGTFQSAELLSADGRRVRTLPMLGRNRAEVNTDGLTPGMYLLRLLPTNGAEVLTRKVLIQ
jgi:hypothetical protein